MTPYRHTLAMLCLTLPFAAQAAGNVGLGSDVFATECAECHSVTPGKNKKGPTLFAVLGRPAASVPGFGYSDGMKQSALSWTPDKLEAYLRAPRKLVPGGKMKYDGLPAGQFDDLLAYLATLK